MAALQKWSALAAFLLALAVAAGAFGAHVLKTRLGAHELDIYEKAVFYQTVHALGMLITALLCASQALSPSAARIVLWLLLGGIFFFSGSLYLLVATGLRWMGAITPVGGTAFIAAWLLMAFGLLRR